jgi:HlyD family secretion protein|uniref:HlyD family efflux transporter periplasmic adaptor subunit n=1 Tax=Desulfomonile tiedjei TaxID=2358 RepID=A0A7C4ESA4_9BACT
MKRIVIPVVLLAIAATGGGLWWRFYHLPTNEGELILYGNVDLREVNLAFNGNQRIEKIYVEEGDRVSKGQLLAELESQRLQDAVKQAKALVEQQDQVLKRLVAGTRIEEIRQAQANENKARVDADNARRTWDRIRALREQQAVSQQQADDAEAAARAAEATWKAAQEALNLALAGSRIEDVEAARYALQAAQANLALREQELRDARLYAPSDGVIRNRILEPGAMVTPQNPVLTLALIDPLWVRCYVSEPDLGKLCLGMKAKITTDSYPGKVYEGWVGFISPTAEFTPKPLETPDLRTRLVYQVRVFVRQGKEELRLGMPATVMIDLKQPPAKDSHKGGES